MAFRVFLLIVLFASCGHAQTANYRGRVYTPENFPRAQWCSCPMCESIRSQWASYSRLANPVVPAANDFVAGERYTTETRTRMVPYQVKRCVGGVCQIVTEYRTETYAVRVPVRFPAPEKTAKQESEFQPTPHAVAKAMVAALNLRAGEAFLDPGCGDGRLVVEAAAVGARAVGIEIEPEIAAKAKQAVQSVDASAAVIVADFSAFPKLQADAVAMYLYSDMIGEVVAKLPKGCRVASYAHEIPGLDNVRHEVGGDVFFTAIVR